MLVCGPLLSSPPSAPHLTPARPSGPARPPPCQHVCRCSAAWRVDSALPGWGGGGVGSMLEEVVHQVATAQRASPTNTCAPRRRLMPTPPSQRHWRRPRPPTRRLHHGDAEALVRQRRQHRREERGGQDLGRGATGWIGGRGFALARKRISLRAAHPDHGRAPGPLPPPRKLAPPPRPRWRAPGTGTAGARRRGCPAPDRPRWPAGA
jgi:hypothetical protein